MNNQSFKAETEQVKIRWEVPARAMEKWDRTIRAKQSDGEVINIYSTIGEYGDGNGMTAKIVSAILRRAEGKPVAVNINSGGGDFFEGLAINTLLAEYEGDVTVNVVGLAASAASVVAMAGDKINIADSAFFMIHNAWTIAMGNKNDFGQIVDMLSKFDESMAKLYAKKTGKTEKEIRKMMDDETWIQGADALEMNFAHALLGSDKIDKDEDLEYANNAVRRVDIELAKAGMPRSERRALLQEIKKGTQDATDPTQDAGTKELTDALAQLLSKFKQTK